MQSLVLAKVELSVCPSVCLSVTRWSCVKTTQARITKSSPTDSPKILVLAIKSSSRNWKGFDHPDWHAWQIFKILSLAHFCSNFAIKWSLKNPPHFKCVATLPRLPTEATMSCWRLRFCYLSNNRCANANRPPSTVCAKKVTPFWYLSFLPLLDALYLQFLFTYISFSLNAWYHSQMSSVQMDSPAGWCTITHFINDIILT